MTKRDFFILIIKVFGLYSIVTVLFSAFSNIALSLVNNTKSNELAWIMPVVLLNAFFVFGLIFILLKKADKVSDFLHLEDGFDEDKIDFGALKSSDILKFTILIIGGLLLINNTPTFLIHSLRAFQAAIPKAFDQAYDNQRMNNYNTFKDTVFFISGLNLLIAYLLITNFKRIANYINTKAID